VTYRSTVTAPQPGEIAPRFAGMSDSARPAWPSLMDMIGWPTCSTPRQKTCADRPRPDAAHRPRVVRAVKLEKAGYPTQSAHTFW
jgi:hypothetical protein